MNPTTEEQDVLEALERAKKLAAACREAAKEFPPEGKALGDQLCAAADRTVLNLSLALRALKGSIDDS